MNKKPTNEELYRFFDDNKEQIFKWHRDRAKFKVGDKVVIREGADYEDYEGKVIGVYISITDDGEDVQYLIEAGMESHSLPEEYLSHWSENWDWTEEETAADKAMSDRDKNIGDQE